MDSLEAVAAELRAAKPAMLAFVPQAEHHIVEAFFSRTVQASGGSPGWLKEAAQFLCSACVACASPDRSSSRPRPVTWGMHQCW